MIRKFLPGKIKKAVRDRVQKIFHFRSHEEHINDFLQWRKEYDMTIPEFDLDNKHIKHLQVLLNRNELLERLPKNAVCAEIGVNEGDFSAKILEVTSPGKLHLIDAWGDPMRYHDGLKLKVKERFESEISSGKVEVNIGFSTDVLKTISNNYFDWVYLDTDHSYHVTSDELEILKHKVKPGGIIAGHDYIIGNWTGDVRYGVMEAVHELCVKDDWELVFITINKSEMPSFAIKKIGE